MLKSAFSQLKAHPGRFAAVCLAIVLGVGFASSTLVFTSSFEKALTASVSAEVSKVDVVVDSNDGEPLKVDTLAALPGVAVADQVLTNYAEFSGPTSRGLLKVTNIPQDPKLRWYTLASGTWPVGKDQVVVDVSTAKRNNLQVGSTLTFLIERNTLAATVVGIVDTKASAVADTSDSAFAEPTLLTRLSSNPGDVKPFTVNLLAAQGTTPDELTATVNALPGDRYLARTAESIGQERIEKLGNGGDVIGIILLAFATLAGLVAAMVVANTFTILLTQRQRQIALMRCIGATGPQVRRSALAEALMIGVIGSVLGVLAGIGVARIAVSVADVGAENFAVKPIPMAVVVVLGILVTLIAALGPTARAMRIPPIAALRPVASAEQRRSAAITRNTIGGLLFVGGGTLLGGGVYMNDLTIAMGGGAITAVGVLVLLRTVLPWILRLFGGLGRLAGTPGKLAVANGLRNPGRAAATCTALVIGVGAIVTLQVAAASAQAGADASLSFSRPLDLQISTAQEDLPAGLESAVAGVDGIASVVPVVGTQVELKGEPDSDYRLYGISSEQISRVLLAGTLDPGTIAVPGWLGGDMAPGDPVSIVRNGQTYTFKLSAQKITDDGSFTVNSVDMAKIDAAAAVRSLWLKFGADASPNDIIAQINPLIAPYPDLQLSGSGTERAALEDVLGTLITVALALLAVAVIIAIVGIGNTLGLSVVERTRESALLRALGLRRGQLRQMLALEAILLAVVAAVVGIVFGVLFGFAAAAAAFGEASRDAAFVVPWGDLGIVFVGAILAGVLASILPARRAARATPVEALAEV